MNDFSQLFLYIPGIIIFMVGSGQVRDYLKKKNLGNCVEATVASCNHIVKKNNRGQDIYNYYAVTVEYMNDKGDKIKKETIKSPVEYYEGQPVKFYKRSAGEEPVIIQLEDEAIFNPFLIMIGGALLILLALYQNKGNEVMAMGCLSAFLIGCGLSMAYSWWSLYRRNLVPIEAEITELYTRQISKESKILKGSKNSYYPIVSYEIDGIKSIRKCNVNSGSEKEFKVGNKITLYYDPLRRSVIEQNAKLTRLVWGIILTAVGILAGLSILSVL